MNILDEVQRYVADRLNAKLSAYCRFVPENAKTVDWEIKKHLGEQGVVGLVLTPKARYAGAFEDRSLAWELEEFEIDVVENPTVNRGRSLSSYMSGQDVAMEVFDELCPLSGEGEGMFCPVSYEEGEDGSLLVNRCVLKCLAHLGADSPTPPVPPVPPDPGKTRLAYDDGRVVELDVSGTLNSEDLPNRDGIRYVGIGSSIDEIGHRAFQGMEFLAGVEIPATVTAIGDWAFAGAEGMADIVIPSSVSSIGSDAFSGCHMLSSVVFEGKTPEQLWAMSNYPWGIADEGVISADCSDCFAMYTDRPDMAWRVQGTQLTANDVPYVGDLTYLRVQEGITRIGVQALRESVRLQRLELPRTLSSVGDGAFYRSGLASLRLPEGLERLGEECFAECRNIYSVSLPSTVRSVGEDAFYECTTAYEVSCWADPSLLDWRGGLADAFTGNGQTRFHVRPEWESGYRRAFPNASVTFVGDLA